MKPEGIFLSSIFQENCRKVYFSDIGGINHMSPFWRICHDKRTIHNTQKKLFFGFFFSRFYVCWWLNFKLVSPKKLGFSKNATFYASLLFFKLNFTPSFLASKLNHITSRVKLAKWCNFIFISSHLHFVFFKIEKCVNSYPKVKQLTLTFNGQKSIFFKLTQYSSI